MILSIARFQERKPEDRPVLNKQGVRSLVRLRTRVIAAVDNIFVPKPMMVGLSADIYLKVDLICS